MLKKIILLIVCIFMLQTILIAQEPDDVITMIREELPAKDVVLNKLNEIEEALLLDEKDVLQKENKKYYSRVLQLINEVEDFEYEKLNVLNEFDVTTKMIETWEKSDVQDFFTLDDLYKHLIDYKKTRELVKEKSIILSRISYDRDVLKQQKASVKKQILRLQTKKKEQELKVKRSVTQEETNVAIEQIKHTTALISIKERTLKAIDLNITLLDEKKPLAEIAIRTFKDLLKHNAHMVDLAKKYLYISQEELEMKNNEIKDGNQIIFEQIETINSQIIDILTQLNTEKDKRAQIHKQLKAGETPELQEQYNISNYTINYYKAQINYLESKIYYYQLEQELQENQFKFLELYALEQLDQLSTRALNARSTNLAVKKEQLSKMKQMAAQTSDSLQASINTMVEMIEEWSIQLKTSPDDTVVQNYNPSKIASLQNEIGLKEEYAGFIDDFIKIIDENMESYEERAHFIQTKVGVKKLLLREKKILGMQDVYVLISFVIFILLFLIVRKKIIAFHKKQFFLKVSTLIPVLFPAFTVILFGVSFIGLVQLYLYLYWSVFYTLLICYVCHYILGSMEEFLDKIEHKADEEMEQQEEAAKTNENIIITVTQKLSIFAMMGFSIIKVLIIFIAAILLFVVWTEPFDLLKLIFQMLNIDPAILTKTIVTKTVKLAIVVGIGGFVIALSKFIGKKIFEMIEDDNKLETNEKEARAQTLIHVATNFIKIVVLTFVIFSFLQEIGVNIATLLTGAGILGLAVGFGAQSLVKDFFSGFFILMENQYAVGDVISINGTGGLVEKITLRVTILRDLSGNRHIFPNGLITAVTNMTHEWSRCVIDVGVAYKENVDRVIDELKTIGLDIYHDAAWKDIINKEPEILGVDKLGDSAVFVRMLAETKPIKQWDVMRELNRRIKNHFDKVGIEIAFPHMQVYFQDQTNKEG